MKHLKTIFACLLMAVLSIGQVWAVDPTISWDFKTLQTTSGTQSGITWETGKTGSATATACTATNGLVLYGVASGGGYFQTTTATSGSITNVNIVSTAKKNTPKYTIYCSTDGSTWTEIENNISAGTKDKAITGSYTYLKIANTTAATAQLAVTSITITYSTGGGSSKDDLTDEQLSWSAASANITFGDEPYSLPSLTNSIPVSLTYESTDATVATISNVGVVSVLKAGSTTIKAVFAGNDDYHAKTVSYTLTVAPAPLTPIAGGIVDEIKISDLLTSGSGYQPFSDKQASNEGHSDAVYAGKVCISSTNIQMNTIGTNTSAGRSIVTTTSGGNAKRVQAFWGGSNTADRKLTVYGSNTAYAGTETAASGTKLGDLTYASGDSYAYIDITGDYAYLQIVASGAIYMSQINITWVAPDVSKVATPQISGTANFYPSTSVSITCGTENAAIYYTTDGTTPTSASTPYEGAFTVNADGTTTVKAIAVKDGMTDSDVAEQTFTKITPITVAEAIALIPNKDDVVNDQYVAGIVCTAAPSLLSGGKLTYYISDDGSETNRLQIYKGKNLNNTEFTAVSDLAIGDRVVVFGQLKNYNNTPEMNDGNYLVSKADPAVATPVFNPNGGGFMGETDVTITCATVGNAIYYTLDGSAPSKLSTLYESAIHLTATTTINAIAFVGDDPSLIVSKTFTLTAPMTVAEALAALDSEDPINNVAVAGIISTAPTANPSSGKLTYYISDDGTDTDELEVFLGFGLNGASFSAKTDLQVGDEVTVFGNLTIYNTTKEFASGNRLLAFNRPVVAVTGIDLTESTAEVEVGKTVTLHASVVPANATNKTIVWSVQSGSDYASVENGVVTGIAAGEAVIRAASDENASIYEECTVTVTEPAPLSPWASVYTSNVEIASNTAAHVTINEENFDAAKTSKGASATITLPQGVTTIHLHLVAWSGEAQTVSVTGDCFNEAKNLSIIANDGVSGSGTTYALGESGVDYYFSLTPDKAVAANTVITITAASGKRFVLFGVNQEGAVTLESISVSGTATALEYNEGDHFSPAGLGVTGHYSDASTAPITEGIVWAFDPDPLTEGTTSVSVTATAGGFTSAAFVVDGLTVAGAAPLSPWASVYTSNVEIASNTAAHVTINEENFDAAKTSKGASATITLPQGVTAIHLHLVAWNGEAQTVSVTGDCFNEAKELSIEANAGVSGSGTTYDLGESGTDYYFSLTPDNEVAANTVITIAAASNKRFVLFGVNQEGGVAPATLESIAISGEASVLEYTAGQHFNPAGLVVTGTYSDASTAPITEGIVWAFDPDPLTEGTESVSVTATAGGFTSAAFVVDGLTVAGAAPLSPWASVYTSNVEIASNTAAHVTINEENFDAAKTSKGASATITLPQGVTTIHLHLVAWSGEAQTVSVTGDCFNEAKELTIVANDGVAGSGTTYDLGASGTDYYFSLTPDNEVAANTVITITAASNKRFVLFGVNQEGGVLPVLDHIAITGTMTNTTGWKTGDHIIPEGLTVNAYYTLNEVEQAPVDVTSSVVWSHAALVADQTEVTLTATYTENEVVKSANANVTIDAVETGDPQIITDPASYLNFGASVEKDAVVAPKTITVTLKNIAGATATLGGTNFSAFSIDNTEIVDGTVITVSVNTATPDTYAGTVTIKDNDSETQKVITLSMTVVEPETPEEAVSTTSEWVAATDEDLVDGAEVLIVGVNSTTSKVYAAGEQGSNNRAAVEASVDGEGVLTPGANTMSFTLIAQEGGTFALRTSNGKYLYAASSTKNYLRSQPTINDDAKWTLTITSASAEASSNNHVMQFNGGSTLFSCYNTASQTAIQFYVEKQETPEPPTPSTPDYTRTVEVNRYGTICLPNGGTISGATLFDLEYYDGASTLYLLQVNGNAMVAGRPYIFLPSATSIEVTYTDDANEPAGSFHGLVGSYTQETVVADDGNYILYENAYYLVNSEAYVGANRAYIHMEDVPDQPTPQLGAAPRRRVAMTVNGTNTATDIDAINASEKPMKLIIDGQIYILRGEKMYDVTGKLVK